MKKLALFILLALVAILSLTAASSSALTEDDFLTEILISDVPVTYGDQSFRERILARTEGKRDPIGLVLTGGSARACAHIGVLRYLDEIGVKPDFIVSNSMGSIIGMLYAAGLTPDQIESLMMAGDIASYFGLTLPRAGGFLTTQGFRTLVESVIGKGYRIEDTEIPIMVVCDDLVSKREVRLAEGDFASILIGSFALPAYFEPFEYNGHLLIDGGTITLAPVSAAYDYSDTVIVSTTFYDVPTMELLNPVTVINVSYDIGKRQNASTQMKEFYDKMIWVRCAVEDYSFMAFDKCPDMAAIGYDSAAENAERLGQLYKSQEEPDQEKLEVLAARIQKVKDNLRYFGRITATKGATTLSMELLGLDSDTTTYYMKNSFIGGLSYRSIVNFFDFSVLTGMGVDSQNLAHNSTFLTTGASASFYPASNMRFKVEGFVDFLRPGSEFHPQFFARQSMDLYAFEKNDSIVRLHEVTEYFKDQNTDANSLGEGFVGSLCLDGVYTGNDYILKGDLGYQTTTSDMDFSALKNYIQATGALSYNLTKTLALDLSARGRFSIDGKDSIPVFISDGYISSTMNYGATVLDTPYSKYVAVLNAKLVANFGVNPTFGEFMIFNEPSPSLFFSGLVANEGLGFTVGAGIDTTMSLLGLIKLPISFKVGYERLMTGDNRATASLTFSTEF